MAGHYDGPRDPNLLRPFGDEPPKPDKFAQVWTTVIEKRKVAVAAPMAPQVMHDAEISWIEDFLHDQVLMKLESAIFQEKVHHGIERVPYSKTKHVSVPSMVWLAVVATVCIVAGIFILFLVNPVWLFVPLFVLYLTTIVGVLYQRKEIEVTVSGHVEFNVDSLIRFPENERVYPKEFGRQYKNVEVRYWLKENDD